MVQIAKTIQIVTPIMSYLRDDLYPLPLTVVGRKLINCAYICAQTTDGVIFRACVREVWQWWLTQRNDTAERCAVIKKAPSIVRKRRCAVIKKAPSIVRKRKEYSEDTSRLN